MSKSTVFQIRNAVDLSQAAQAVKSSGYPCTVTIERGKKRSVEQNRLQRLWLLEAQDQGDQTAEEYRAYCKLHFGVPILRAENYEFRGAYDRLIRPRPYEEKLELMMVPLDFPVTRLMTTKQKTEYLDAMYRHFLGLGFRMTEPDHG